MLRANPLIGGDQQLTPNTSMDESLFLDTSNEFMNDEASMLCFAHNGSGANKGNDVDMTDSQAEQFFRNMYIRLN